jgi:hypothetical protein
LMSSDVNRFKENIVYLHHIWFQYKIFGHSNTTMLDTHVTIDTLPSRECLHAHPTDMSLALRTGDVVTPLRSFDRDFATWAVLHVVCVNPFLEAVIVITVPVKTFETVVVLDMTLWTDPKQARRTLDNGSLWRKSIDLETIRSWAVMKLLGSCMDVSEKRRLHNVVEFTDGQDLPRDGEGNAFAASGTVTQTCQREKSVFGRCIEVIDQARSAIDVTALERHRNIDFTKTDGAGSHVSKMPTILLVLDLLYRSPDDLNGFLCTTDNDFLLPHVDPDGIFSKCPP